MSVKVQKKNKLLSCNAKLSLVIFHNGWKVHYVHLKASKTCAVFSFATLSKLIFSGLIIAILEVEIYS